jgi:predicted DNA-binding transcriptional regulator AlpA
MDARLISLNRETVQMHKRLRYADLVALGVVNNRATLSNWIKNEGFPPGQLTGPNSRTWDEGEVTKWLANRPTAQKPVPQSKGRPRKAAGAGAHA